MRREHQRRPGQQRDRCQVIERIVVHILEEILVERDFGGRRDEQHISVRIRSGDSRSADHSAGAGPILDNEGLPEDAEFLGKHAGNRIGSPAGRIRHDHEYRLGRPILRLAGRTQEKDQAKR